MRRAWTSIVVALLMAASSWAPAQFRRRHNELHAPTQLRHPRWMRGWLRLLARMTLLEKLGQLQQLDGEANGNFRPEHLDLARKGLLGSVLNVRGAAQVNELQKAAVEGSRLKIPILFGYDTIHGYRTIFPIPLGEAASFDPALAEATARVAAAESAAVGLKWTFAPMVDVARDPRWGRVAEGAGEDPYLGSVLARARVRGFQGEDYAQPDRVVATAKHWVAYGAAEAGRDYNTTDVSERALREIYFPPFKAALDAGVGTLMSAFNDIDGTPATANPFTLTRVLRGEWRFDGLVVSDYTSVLELLKHGVAADEAEAARKALTAGVDMEMVSRTFVQRLPDLVRKGTVPVAIVDEAVRRVLRIKLRAGIFERPYVDAEREKSALLTPESPAARAQGRRAIDGAAAERRRRASAAEGHGDAGRHRPSRRRSQGRDRHLVGGRQAGGRGQRPGRHPGRGRQDGSRAARQGMRDRGRGRRGLRGGRRCGQAGGRGRHGRGRGGRDERRGVLPQRHRPPRTAAGPGASGPRGGQAAGGPPPERPAADDPLDRGERARHPRGLARRDRGGPRGRGRPLRRRQPWRQAAHHVPPLGRPDPALLRAQEHRAPARGREVGTRSTSTCRSRRSGRSDTGSATPRSSCRGSP